MKMRPMSILAASVGFLVPGLALSQDMMAMDEDSPVDVIRPAIGSDGYNYDEHFCLGFWSDDSIRRRSRNGHRDG